MRTVIKLISLCLLMLPVAALPAEKGLAVNGVRYFSYASFTRIVFEVEAAAPYVLTRTADGHSLLLSAYDGTVTFKSPLPSIRDSVVSGVEQKEDAGRTVVAIRLDAAAGEVKDFVLRGPDRIVVDIAKGAALAPVPQPGRPLVVVLDAGHGGTDTGTVTAQGQEKTIALDLAQAIKKILQRDPRLHVVLTREKDVALSLSERAAAANTSGASVFVSIHIAPGTNDRIYIQDPGEDMGVQAVQSVSRDFLSFEAGSEQREMLWGRQQAAHAQESNALGRQLARQLEGKDNAEPLQMPLAGLKAVDSAAVMIEVGAGRNRAQAAEAAAKGIEQYVRENR
jgi:N-acetylmuramoyl-L-alanine amidase